MKQFAVSLLSFLFITAVAAQKVGGRLQFEQGRVIEISMETKITIAQQAMGQAIDFTIDAAANHSYKVTNSTADNTTLNHTVQRLTFSFDGMGQKRNFDSNNQKDLDGPFGKPVKDLLTKKYDVIIDSAGKVLMAMPEKIELAEGDSRMAIITNMLGSVMDVAQPPQKGKASFFKVLPDTEAGKGDTWTVSYEVAGGKADAAYAISDINDSTIIVSFAENSTTLTKAEMMGSEVTTTMKNQSTGAIILDRLTGIIRKKTINTESTGTTESSFGNLPVTSKTTTVITVK